ncbi:orotidine-5'-phosphate decarboxylase [Desulfogranum mediterraneum]|uniref:orotidine-5'-phosphate decarboxylase n=1 Tax=Desulfogranum mediterraneum TaxID=160661 RepID=UPI000403B5F1|nr:orotidine-5'-phosphate decarboxylase [Desulfogranum mediterraneum]
MKPADIALNERIIFALDVAEPRQAMELVDRLDSGIKYFKVGMQLFFAGGWPVVEYIAKRGNRVMLDLKLYDIPATVRLAVEQFRDRGVTMTTVHACGPVVEAALAADTGIDLLAVTVLTSLGEEHLRELRYPGSLEELVLERATTALDLGCHGVVCSAREASLLRARLGRDFLMVTPGIRPSGSADNDQQRIATPGQAIADGATYLVVGRPIRDAGQPVEVIAAIQAEIAAALTP